MGVGVGEAKYKLAYSCGPIHLSRQYKMMIVAIRHHTRRVLLGLGGQLGVVLN